MRKPTGRPRRGRGAEKEASGRRWEAAVRSRTRVADSASLVEEVHQIRVLAKKLRAYLRLLRGTLPEKLLEREERRIQRIAAGLSPARDAAICRQILRWLVAKEGKEIRRERLRAALAHFPEAVGGNVDPRAIARARAGIEARRRRLLKLIDEHPPQEQKLEKLLRSEYGKSRQRMREALREGSPDAFHQWRKRVKRLGYQTEIFCTSSRRSLARLEAKLVRLGKLLGKLQDLRVLKNRIEAHAASAEQKLLPLLEDWMAHYRKEVEREGEDCFRLGKGKFRTLLE
ncbi:CHAD domain-containing protein [Methylacidimicrobium sp. B4]|uniref:CHAD domain-containing protein n=1 Tax=Methylacidimicrobium sp. B4 TaxID=2796139 RepID=UPI001A8E58F1|nr:CHAD domain-containing protein [Methylacidimicrobium sp. B4]QSR84597.1 CHAD domain-containing protein [Methylacidimicrobium sp. B4]